MHPTKPQPVPLPKKNSLAIRLTESAVFLRTDYSPRRQNSCTTSSTRNGMLRGLLVLEISKPTKISSVEVELCGTSSVNWPEGVGSRRIEVNEEHKIFHASTTYFRACPPSLHSQSHSGLGPTSSSQSGSSTHHGRRTASIGPGVSYNVQQYHSQTVHHDIEDSAVDDEDDDSHEEPDGSPEGEERRGRPVGRVPLSSAGGLATPSSDADTSNLLPISVPIIRPPTTSRPSSRRVSIDGSQLIRPSPQFYENYPGELAPIPPYSVLPPPLPNQSLSSSSIYAVDGSSGLLDPRRANFAETIPEDELEARFDHHGLLRHHHDHEDEDDEPEVGLTVDHQVALESPRPGGIVPSFSLGEGGSGLSQQQPHSPIVPPSPSLLGSAPSTMTKRSMRRGVSPAPMLGPVASTSGGSVASSSSGSSGRHRRGSLTLRPPPSPNPSLSHSGSPRLSSVIPGSPILSNVLQNRSLDSGSARSTANNHTTQTRLNRHRSPSSERAKVDPRNGSKRFSFSAVTNMFKDALRSSSPRRSGSAAHRLDSETGFDARRTSVDTLRGRTSMESLSRQRSNDTRADRGDTVLDIEEEDEEDDSDNQRGRSMFGKILLGGGGSADKDKEGWKEFKRGTYTYPISFSIPSNAPPSMQCDYGSVHWQLRANVHRPGAFKSRMTAQREVVIISCPTEEDTEDTENIIVERHWEQQLQYLITVSGRSFHIGGTVPVTLTLMPLAKVKIHRLSVIIEEKVDYYTNMRRVARSDEPIKFVLLEIRRDGKNNKPILPLDSNNVNVLRDSPLMDLFDADKDDLGEVASNLMGPGPWTFHKNLKLPTSCDILRFTNRNKRANMQVTHLLKVVMRVERGDDVHLDKNGNRKLFDIVVQTPVLILSCRCNPEWTSLPRYTASSDNLTDISSSCPCHTHANLHAHFRTLDRTGSRHSSDDSLASTAETNSIPPFSLRSIRHQNFSESMVRQSSLFERLVSGQESETGEQPPAYNIPSEMRPPVALRNVMVAG